MLSVLRTAWQSLLYIIAPPACYACRTFISKRDILCDVCNQCIEPIAPKLFRVNKQYTMVVHAICKYDNNPLKRFILAKHYSDIMMIEAMAELMWQKTVLSHLEVDYIIPVPLHWTRRVKRGFNQSEVLAKVLSNKNEAPMYNCLKRVKKTHYQARLQQELRKDNVKGAFIMYKDGHCLKGKHIVLVDDLCTTGSTAIEVAKVLVRYKPASINLVVACRAL